MFELELYILYNALCGIYLCETPSRALPALLSYEKAGNGCLFVKCDKFEIRTGKVKEVNGGALLELRQMRVRGQYK